VLKKSSIIPAGQEAVLLELGGNVIARQINTRRSNTAAGKLIGSEITHMVAEAFCRREVGRRLLHRSGGEQSQNEKEESPERAFPIERVCYSRVPHRPFLNGAGSAASEVIQGGFAWHES
jgi:hypothetical protein